ncbi:MAG: DUF503 domain-containing protein [Firmicutes bacterium]|jgi:uncharacterized protein YlxP (DUF503 family)|nr:DUF503 domain-containing protein [Bacillota bacterium]
MVIGVLEIQLYLHGVRSLKGKRSLLQPLLHKLRRKFNVSVLETGARDLWQRSEVAVVCAAATPALAHRELEAVLAFTQREPGLEISDYTLEII